MMDGWHPYPSTALSKATGLSLYKTRKILKELKAKGLVKSDREVIRDPEEGTAILNGYTITNKARETPEYKKAFEKERRICKECFGIDIANPDNSDIEDIPL